MPQNPDPRQRDRVHWLSNFREAEARNIQGYSSEINILVKSDIQYWLMLHFKTVLGIGSKPKFVVSPTPTNKISSDRSQTSSPPSTRIAVAIDISVGADSNPLLIC